MDCRGDLTTNHHTRFFFVAAFLLFCLFVSTPRAQAGESGLTGFEICSTAAPGNQFYVAGDPVYISEIFHVAGESTDHSQEFRDFLKQKYGWTKPYVNCPVAYTSDGATKTFNAELQQAGQNLVRTGWTPPSKSSSASPSATAAPTPATAPSAPASAAGQGPQAFYICVANVDVGSVAANNYHVDNYYSDVFEFAAGGAAQTTLAKAFRQFLASKYNAIPQNQGPVCPGYGDADGEERARNSLKIRLANDSKSPIVKDVLTGWKYVDQSASAGPVVSASAAQPPAPAAPPAAPAPPSAAQQQYEKLLAAQRPATNTTAQLNTAGAEASGNSAATDTSGQKYSYCYTIGNLPHAPSAPARSNYYVSPIFAADPASHPAPVFQKMLQDANPQVQIHTATCTTPQPMPATQTARNNEIAARRNNPYIGTVEVNWKP